MPSNRQLAAIMFTDIVGYTALMGEDEGKAFELLRKNRQLHKPIIEQYNGTWIKEIGDGVLASFHTVTDAVLCAIAIQQACNQMEDLKLRIGIHQGEVVFEDKDVFGDGVNIASRLQVLAPIGETLVSEAVYTNIKNRHAFETEFFGEETLKNISAPVKVYRIKANSTIVDPAVNAYSENKPRERRTIDQRKLVPFILGIAVLLVIALFFYLKKSWNDNIETTTDKSIAVLPFVNMSNDKSQEYFSDGLSEELLNLLAKIPELKVIGRTSSFSFKGKNEDLRSIAQKLGVAHLLEGSVRRDSNRVRVSAQLIKASDGSNLWSETYDRKLEDIFKMQDEIAGEVVNQLKVKLSVVRTNAATSVANTEAYNLLLQGNYFLDKRDRESVAKALKFYRQALAVDSLNARAWAAVAKCLNIQTSWGWIDQKGFEEAKQAAIKAVALDDKQAETHRTLGETKMFAFDWLGADAEYRKALNLEPGNPDVLRHMGILAIALGRTDEAINFCTRSLVFDPIRPITYHHLGIDQFYANRLDEAIVSFRKALELNPQFPRPHTFLGEVFLLQGRLDTALAEVKQETDETWKGYGLSLAYYALGHLKEADEELRKYIAKFQKGNPLEIAEIYAFRGEKDSAFQWLEKAYQGRASRLVWFKNNPLLKKLEHDPRHIAFLKKMNLPLG